MLTEDQLNKYLEYIFDIHKLGSIETSSRLNIGYNRVVTSVNNELVVKMCFDATKLDGFRREIEYYENDKNTFHPNLITYDLTGNVFPFYYSIEEKVHGINLFTIWGTLSQEERKKVLMQLTNIFKIIHDIRCLGNQAIFSLQADFDKYLGKIITMELLPQGKVDYLCELKNRIDSLFKTAKFGMIHGDIHYNNIVYLDGEIKIVDFECYKAASLDREFDTLSRMVRNPNGFIHKESQTEVDSKDYKDIIPFFKEYYPEVCSLDGFGERLLMYDCLNSLKWYTIYPEHKPYNEILFEKSQRLTR